MRWQVLVALVLLAPCLGACQDRSSASDVSQAAPASAAQASSAPEAIAKERAEIPDPPPVVLAGLRYQALPFGKARGLGQNGGYVVAVDDETGAEQWLLKVYDVSYDRDMEGDKQDVFITKLVLSEDRKSLRVENERGEAFAIDLETRHVEGPLAKRE